MSYTGSQAFAPIGSKLQLTIPVGSPAVPTLTTIAEIQNIQRSGSKSDLVDVTNMQSTGGYREYLATLRDAGDVSFTGNYIPNDATQAALQGLFDSATLTACAIILPPGPGYTTSLGTWSFNAYVQSNDYDLPHDKEGKISGKLKITGKPTFTAGS
jgi:predicted secreted protein